MKKLFTLALLALLATGANAQDKKDDANKNKPVFTVVKSNPISRTRTVAVPAGTSLVCHTLRAKS